jgi:hypothetical protein
VTAVIRNRERAINVQSGKTSTAKALEAVFEGRWGVWLSDTGRWWATRRSALTAAELTAGCVPFLRADTETQLAEHIQAQEDLAAEVGGRPPQPAAASRAGRRVSDGP